MKTVNSTSGKGHLEINFDEGIATFTVVTKDSEDTYNFFEILERFNNKQISFTLKEENDIDPITE